MQISEMTEQFIARLSGFAASLSIDIFGWFHKTLRICEGISIDRKIAKFMWTASERCHWLLKIWILHVIQFGSPNCALFSLELPDHGWGQMKSGVGELKLIVF